MGNSKSKSKLSQNDEYETKQENRFLYINNVFNYYYYFYLFSDFILMFIFIFFFLLQISLPNFASTLSALSGRSFGSAFSHQSTYSVSRPWSRVSRKRWFIIKESGCPIPVIFKLWTATQNWVVCCTKSVAKN